MKPLNFAGPKWIKILKHNSTKKCYPFIPNLAGQPGIGRIGFFRKSGKPGGCRPPKNGLGQRKDYLLVYSDLQGKTALICQWKPWYFRSLGTSCFQMKSWTRPERESLQQKRFRDFEELYCKIWAEITCRKFSFLARWGCRNCAIFIRHYFDDQIFGLAMNGYHTDGLKGLSIPRPICHRIIEVGQNLGTFKPYLLKRNPYFELIELLNSLCYLLKLKEKPCVSTTCSNMYTSARTPGSCFPGIRSRGLWSR